jgi:hypothetical protein
MSSIFARRVREHSHESVLSFCCPNCESSLTLHQPDPELPERLLATCDDCKSWYVTGPPGRELIRVLAFANDFSRE